MSQQTVMIVEDEPLTALMLHSAVKRRGLQTAGPFQTTQEALAGLDTTGPGGEGVCAALLDVSLAGGQTSAPVAAALAEAGVPFAFVTGYGPETNAVVRAHPGQLVIPKPASEETIDMLLSELLGESGCAADG